MVLILLAFIILLIQAYGKAYRANGYDFTSYLLSAKALLNGQSPYQTGSPFPYIYPMVLAFLLIPLTLIPYWLANFIWYAAGVGSLAGSAITLINLNGLKDKPQVSVPLYPLLAGLLILMYAVIQNNLLNGQVNFVVLYLCVLFLKFFLEGRLHLAAILLALAASLKLVPLILLLYALTRRQYRMVAITLLLFAGFCVLPYLTLGNKIWTIYGSYMDGFILGTVKGAGEGTGKQLVMSLSSALTYLFPLVQGWAPKVISVFVIVLALIGVDILCPRTKPDRKDNWMFGLYMLAVLLVMPMSETHHLAFALPAVLLLLLASMFSKYRQALRASISLGGFFLFFYLGRAFSNAPWYFGAVLVLFFGSVVTALHPVVPRDHINHGS